MIFLNECCKAMLYCATWLQGNETVTVYVRDRDRRAVGSRLRAALNGLPSQPSSSVKFSDLRSYHEMTEEAVRQEMDIRVLDMALRERNVSQWVDRSPFSAHGSNAHRHVVDAADPACGRRSVDTASRSWERRKLIRIFTSARYTGWRREICHEGLHRIA